MTTNALIRQGMAVVVMGLGISGRAALRYLHMLGARVFVSDARLEKDLAEEDRKLLSECAVAYEGGGHSVEFLTKGELVIVSPGIPTTRAVFTQVREAGIPVIGELALAAPALQCRVVAVTGTNGKTTVTTLIGEFLKAAGKEVFVCGNIGTPLLECLMMEHQPEVAVVEVSSFQLENAGAFRPDVAVILNITPDHLDWHGSYAGYIGAKAKIFGNQRAGDTAILGAENLICRELAEHLKGDVKPVLFGHTKDCRGYICESEMYVRGPGEVEKYDLTGTVFDNPVGRTNSAAAILAAKFAGGDREAITATLRTFEALPHRMETVDVIDGITYCNDSKATNTGAVISALLQAKGRVVLIAGGRDKGDDYRLLRDSVRQKVRKLILIGETATQIGEQLEDLVEVDYAFSMEEAVAKAGHAAQFGDTVLLSPACASFDMFDGYAHRGRVFRESVAAFKMKRATAKRDGKES
jgi:UDP-N-acetylmuramoylalanine--D-glutamate ligase